MILEFFCKRNAIFECGAEQKYQINPQLCGWTGAYPVSILYRIQTTAPTARMEKFSSSDRRSAYGETMLEIVRHVCTDVGKLGSGSGQVADLHVAHPAGGLSAGL